MREMVKMVIVLTVLSAVSGGSLAWVRDITAAGIEKQELLVVKGPAIKEILEGATNDPLNDRFKIKDADTEISFYVGVFDGEPNVVVFETFGKGFGGDLGLMVAVNIKDDKIHGAGVTTHSETPGVGSRAQTDPAFAAQFKGMPAIDTFKVKTDGGQVDAVSGATVTSRGVSSALTDAGKLYQRLKPQISENLKGFK
ncbi:RnfABCDGE type electron transport complex subunit G [Thermodesulfobacteriota bacterium]